jgi:hypothetical protein
MFHACGRVQVCIGFCEDLSVGERITLNGPQGDMDLRGYLDSAGSR